MEPVAPLPRQLEGVYMLVALDTEDEVVTARKAGSDHAKGMLEA